VTLKFSNLLICSWQWLPPANVIENRSFLTKRKKSICHGTETASGKEKQRFRCSHRSIIIFIIILLWLQHIYGLHKNNFFISLWVRCMGERRRWKIDVNSMSAAPYSWQMQGCCMPSQTVAQSIPCRINQYAYISRQPAGAAIITTRLLQFLMRGFQHFVHHVTYVTSATELRAVAAVQTN